MAISTLLDPMFNKAHFQDPMTLSAVMRHMSMRRKMSEITNRKDSIGSGSEASSAGDTGFDLWATHKALAQDELNLFVSASVLELKFGVATAWDERNVQNFIFLRKSIAL